MNGLAAAAANQTLMFQAGVLDVGHSGKRYGVVQCIRDISRANCSKCLDAQLMTFRTIVGNSRGWEIYGYSCSMWYHDYQFYFNISTSSNDGARRPSLRGVAIAITMVGLVFVLVLEACSYWMLFSYVRLKVKTRISYGQVLVETFVNT